MLNFSSIKFQRLFALRSLRAHGMADFLLHDVTKASLVSQLTYAAPQHGVFFYEKLDTNNNN